MMRLRAVEVGGRPSRVWTGGEGEPLVLVHGGWGGAEMHWAPVWELAARLGPRCRGVVLVNGMPFEMPPLMRGLAAIAPVRRLLRSLYRKLAFSPAILPRAYADPACAPVGLTQVLRDPPPAQLDALFGIAFAGARFAPPPVVPLLIVWGEADRLPGTSRETARKLQRRVAGARLIFIPSAGHCPQVERPGEFVEAITSFMTSSSGASPAD